MPLLLVTMLGRKSFNVNKEIEVGSRKLLSYKDLTMGRMQGRLKYCCRKYHTYRQESTIFIKQLDKTLNRIGQSNSMLLQRRPTSTCMCKKCYMY